HREHRDEHDIVHNRRVAGEGFLDHIADKSQDEERPKELNRSDRPRKHLDE
ncbi:MAG: hypothetical protein Q9187_008230, partial [Circinaria calcarea]